jgi:hypothetical protein
MEGIAVIEKKPRKPRVKKEDKPKKIKKVKEEKPKMIIQHGLVVLSFE